MSKKTHKVLSRHLSLLRSNPLSIRNSIIQAHFPVLLQPPIIEERNINNFVNDIIKKEIVHPPVFLASSLGFTKSNLNKSIEKLLIEFKFSNRLKYPNLKNMIKYEKMKMMIMRYFEKKKEIQ